MSHLKNGEHEDSNVKDFFSKQWKVYEKLLNNNYMGHREIYRIFNELLVSNFQKPFKILELGCGDARFTSQALLNTRVTSYQGIDLSMPALEIAKENLAKINCEKSLIEGDFSQLGSLLHSDKYSKFDVILMSFALHHQHLEEKYYFIEQIYKLLNPEGIFVLIDVIRQPDEERNAYVKRYLENVKKYWSLINQQEYSIIEEHISSSDFPETQQTLQDISEKLGFSRFECLYSDSLDTTQLLCFYKS